MLGTGHIAYMIVVGIITFLLHKFIISGKIKMDIYLKVAAVFTLTLDPLYWWWEVDTYGQFDWATTLPLYVCSLFWILMPIVAFSKKKGTLYRAATSCVATVCFYGGLFGMVLNHHISNYGFMHFVAQRSLLYHAIMIITIVLMWSTGYYRPLRPDRYLFVTPLLALLLPAFIIDKVYGYNYCYFNGGEGAVMNYFTDRLGLSIFLLVFYGFLIVMIYLFLSYCSRNKAIKRVGDELHR